MLATIPVNRVLEARALNSLPLPYRDEGMRLQAQRFFFLNLIILFLTHANSVFHLGPYCSSELPPETPAPSPTQSPNSSLDSFRGGANTSRKC